MTAETAAELLPAVKTYLQIPWTDEETDNRLLGILRRSAAYLDRKRGSPADYIQEGPPRELLFERCRYARDNALDVFETNYRSELLSLQNERRVARYVQDTAAADQGGE